MFLTVLHSDVSLPEYISYSKDHVNLNSSKIPFWCFVREHFWANFRASSTTSLSVIIQLEIKDTNYLTCIYLCGQNKVTFKTLKSCGSCSKFMCSTHIRFILWGRDSSVVRQKCHEGANLWSLMKKLHHFSLPHTHTYTLVKSQ